MTYDRRSYYCRSTKKDTCLIEHDLSNNVFVKIITSKNQI